MTILATSPNGLLRLRRMKNGNGVVELNCNGTWVWCVWRSSPIERAWSTFNGQVQFHQEGMS
jgi:hypothetical protein